MQIKLLRALTNKSNIYEYYSRKNVLILYLALIINGIGCNSSKGILKKIYKKVYHIDKKIGDKFGYGMFIKSKILVCQALF